MNLIEVKGGTKFQKDVVHKVITHLIPKLLPRVRTLMIDVHIKNLKGDAAGYCLADDTRTFEIEIEKNQNLRDFVTTVCHEMVHVKQYAKKEVDLYWNKNPRWKTKRIGENVKYPNQPWEKEAYRLQDRLAQSVWDSYIL